jgi:hypothetical protein
MSPYTTSLGWQEMALVAFERGFLQIELPAPLVVGQSGRVRVFRDGEKDGRAEPNWFEPVLPPVHAMQQQATNFLAAVRGESTPLCEAAEALEDLKIARDYLRLWQQD